MKRLLLFWFFSATGGFVAVALTVLLIACAFDRAQQAGGAKAQPSAAATQVAGH